MSCPVLVEMASSAAAISCRGAFPHHAYASTAASPPRKVSPCVYIVLQRHILVNDSHPAHSPGQLKQRKKYPKQYPCLLSLHHLLSPLSSWPAPHSVRHLRMEWGKHASEHLIDRLKSGTNYLLTRGAPLLRLHTPYALSQSQPSTILNAPGFPGSKSPLDRLGASNVSNHPVLSFE